jgi:hypothetical protein
MAALLDFIALRTHKASAAAVLAALAPDHAPLAERAPLFAAWTVGPDGALTCQWHPVSADIAPLPD